MFARFWWIPSLLWDTSFWWGKTVTFRGLYLYSYTDQRFTVARICEVGAAVSGLVQDLMLGDQCAMHADEIASHPLSL